jgi:hypothetical protein
MKPILRPGWVEIYSRMKTQSASGIFTSILQFKWYETSSNKSQELLEMVVYDDNDMRVLRNK